MLFSCNISYRTRKRSLPDLALRDKLRAILLGVALLVIPYQVLPQACCSGGVPLGGSLGLGTADHKSLQFLATYDYNLLNDLMDVSEILPDDTRQRTTHSAILEVNYGISPRFSIAAVLPLIIQERNIISSGGVKFGNEFQFNLGVNYNTYHGQNRFNPDDWLIPANEVRDGGPGKDGIPSIDNPQFISVEDVNFLSNDDLVLGFADNNVVRAYAHRILDWHEIVNDEINDHALAVNYCPLTGTGIGWNRIINGTKTTFGVSGLLYNSNIIPYDRLTDSYWSQLLHKSVNGQLIGTEAQTYNLIETTWETWKELYPESQILSQNTGFSRNYDRYPYGNYQTNSALLFPVNNTDNRLHNKERVLAVFVEDNMTAYRFGSFDNSLSMVNDEILSKKIVVTGSKKLNLIVAFNRTLADGTNLDFEPMQNELPVVLMDNEGTRWDVFGRGISGPRAGQQLKQETQMMGYWFSFAAFYPNVRIYDF